MSVKIRDLSPELQELCHKRQIEQGNDGTFKDILDTDIESGNFMWEITPEGYNFWEDLNDGYDMTDSPFYPKSNQVINNYSIF